MFLMLLNAVYRYVQIINGFPSNVLFYDIYNQRADAAIAMYHDQGLIPFKMVARDEGVNVTLGLPFIRTSPDHGTAYDIAWKNKAVPDSMLSAVRVARQMVKNGRRKAVPQPDAVLSDG